MQQGGDRLQIFLKFFAKSDNCLFYSDTQFKLFNTGSILTTTSLKKENPLSLSLQSKFFLMVWALALQETLK
jgi:hypothetical protein